MASVPPAYTLNHYWYSDGPVLYRRHLKTQKAEWMHRYAADILCLQANDDWCIVETVDGSLWFGDQQIASKVKTWILTPQRVVINDFYGRIGVWSGETTDFGLQGHLFGASDDRILYGDAKRNRKWQSGQSATKILSLSPNDEAVEVGDGP